jgi:hypothetical protein
MIAAPKQELEILPINHSFNERDPRDPAANKRRPS